MGSLLDSKILVLIKLKAFTDNKFNVVELFSKWQKLDEPKLKAFADDKIKGNWKIEICIGKDRKHCWKKRNAGYHNVFKRLISLGC